MPVYSAPMGESISGVHPLLERSNGAHAMPGYSAPLGESVLGVHPHFLKGLVEPMRCPGKVHTKIYHISMHGADRRPG